MSKNITIQEGGVARNFGNVAKLQTALVGGGSCYWVPEEETQLKTKHITENGTYKAASDDAYGYSEVTVNVRGGNGSADSGGIPTTDGGTLPGGIGSSVVGTDPETGNDVAVGVDEDGNLVTTPVPSAIKIIKPPDKTEYTEGEQMDYTGIIVHLLNKDGSTFTSARYPGGTVPFNQLVFPVEVAPDGGEDADAWTDGDEINVRRVNFQDIGGYTLADGSWQPVYLYPTALSTYNGYPFTFGGGDKPVTCYITRYDGRVYTYYTADDPAATYTRERGYVRRDGEWRFTIGGQIDRIINEWGVCIQNKQLTDANIPISTKDPTGAEPGTLKPLGYKIPAQWKSPYDGRTFEDTFEITVTGTDPDGGGDGGGAGHGF